MNKSMSYSEARANLAKLWDKLVQERSTMILTRKGKEDIAMLPAEELRGLIETAHLLRSPKNAERLLGALERSLKKTGKHESIETLRESVGLNDPD